VRIALRLVSIVAMALGVSGMAFAADDAHTVLVGHIEGVINPITARYVDRMIDEGEERKVAAVVFVIDTPGGMGKVSIGPDYVVARGPDKWTLRNYEGKLVDYPQPADKDATCAYDEIYFGA